MTKYGMAIDLNHCVGCQTCTVSCQLNNGLRPAVSRIRVDALEQGRWPDVDLAFFPHACIHCDDPLCVRVCPTGASHKREDGIVVIDDKRCIGCGVCITACEYGARSLNLHDRPYFDAEEPAPYETEGMQPFGVADKCSFCAERVDAGREPACVRDCVVGVRTFGDLDDPESAVNAFITRHKCENVPGSALYYHLGKRDLDLRELITAGFTSAKEDRAHQHPAETPTNPAVIGVAVVATAAVATGLGVSAKRSRAKRRRDGQTPPLHSEIEYHHGNEN